MPITICLVDPHRYTAKVTPPHGGGREWDINTPVTARELTALLTELGCHQTDIGDAFYEVDPEWLSYLDG